MTERFEGTYFDGQDGRAHAVELRRVGASHYAISGEGIARGGRIADLSVTPRLARVARTIELRDGARLLLAHDAPIDAWFPQRNRIETLVDRMERHAHAVAAAIVVAVGTIGVGAVWGVPFAADRVADHVPRDVERTLGEEVLSNMDRLGLKASRLDAARREALAVRFARLGDGLEGAEAYRVEFRDAPGVGPNAFALPGGTVVVTDQLVRAIGDDREFDAVVAHEIGHQQHRHALRQALRGSLVAVVAALFAGDVSSASTVVVAIPTFLLTSHYSRGFEAEADAFAFDLLARHGESPSWFARAIGRLQAHAKRRDDEEVAYLSSHPTNFARTMAAQAAGRAFAAAHPALCPHGVCPGDPSADDEDGDCEDCEDTDASTGDPEAESLACHKDDGA